MKFALVNPNWTFEGSIYFGCREAHLPLEFGYSKALLEAAGHEAILFDAQLERLSHSALRARIRAFSPDFTVITTAPSYLFWRCAPPELRIPLETVESLRGVAGDIVIVGPHGSTTPRSTLRKLDVAAVLLGECEEILPRLLENWNDVPPLCFRAGGDVHLTGSPHASDMAALPALRWPLETVERHLHHHHRFERPAFGPGAEMEASRGCPYHCTFCAKDNFRDRYRRRPLATILAELEGLLAQGVQYIYFIDEIFLPNQELLQALREYDIRFGMQTRIDLWSVEQLDLLGDAGCVSIEAGVESITEEGRDLLAKRCHLSTEELTALLLHARRRVPFVQANLIGSPADDRALVEAWRNHLREHHVWANEPVPLFPYPGSPEYTQRWGAPDDLAWERAHEYYLRQFAGFSDIQEERPLPLVQLECNATP